MAKSLRKEIDLSFAIQCIEENIIGKGGYADEIDIYNKFEIGRPYIFAAFHELISWKLLSKEYYEGKGHKVLG